MSGDAPVYGLWSLVIINSAVFILFAYSFFKPQTSRDWRSFSAFSGFLVALFAEMYGFPLTVYFMSGWLQSRFPDIDWFSHDAGHLLEMMFGWKTNPHAGPFHILSFVFIGGGFILISTAWKVLYDAQQTRGVRRCVRQICRRGAGIGSEAWSASGTRALKRLPPRLMEAPQCERRELRGCFPPSCSPGRESC